MLIVQTTATIISSIALTLTSHSNDTSRHKVAISPKAFCGPNGSTDRGGFKAERTHLVYTALDADMDVHVLEIITLKQ